MSITPSSIIVLHVDTVPLVIIVVRLDHWSIRSKQKIFSVAVRHLRSVLYRKVFHFILVSLFPTAFLSLSLFFFFPFLISLFLSFFKLHLPFLFLVSHFFLLLLLFICIVFAASSDYDRRRRGWYIGLVCPRLPFLISKIATLPLLESISADLNRIYKAPTMNRHNWVSIATRLTGWTTGVLFPAGQYSSQRPYRFQVHNASYPLATGT